MSLKLNSHLKDFILKLAKDKQLEMTSSRESRIREIERKLDDRKISIEDVITALRKEFSYHLDDSGYKEIKKYLESRGY